MTQLDRPSPHAERRALGPGALGLLSPAVLGIGLSCLGLLALAGCGADEPPAGTGEAGAAGASDGPRADALPDEIVVEAPTRLHTVLDYVETESETVADRLLEFSDQVRKREFEALDDWFARGFAGHALVPCGIEAAYDVAGGIRRVDHDVKTAPIVDSEGFVNGLQSWIGDWRSVDSVLFKVKKADFQKGRPEWGKLHLKIHLLGRGADGSLVAIGGRADARTVRERGRYRLERLKLTELHVETRARALFADVTAPAGVAHTWARFGTDANNSFHWNGAAAGDVDGDGDWDLFVPSDGRNFLYLAEGDGTYAEAAEERGVARPDAGTGALFADFDRDGDQDLMVGHVGWPARKGAMGGERIRVYLNDGAGTFNELESAGPGLMGPFLAYSLTALDYDADGWLDVFVCGYGRVDVEHNDSWTEATNGSPNGLLRCLGVDDEGRFLGFEDVAERAGVRGTSWSYAAAAADVDQDGDTDLFVANDYGSNRLWLNAGDGTFQDGADALGVTDRGNGMGVTFGDLSGDGRLDLYVSNMSSTAGNRILGRLGDELDADVHALLKKLAAGNSIFLAGGSAEDGFQRLPRERGGIDASWAWSAALFDVELDGDLDVFCANGFITGELPFDT